MCNLYTLPTEANVFKSFAPWPDGTFKLHIGPLGYGMYYTEGNVTAGQWGLIPDVSPTKRPSQRNGFPLSTNNCRDDRMETAPSFKGPWKKNQRCLIPAATFDEPYYATRDSKNVWWRFSRSDGLPWALAGLWNDWVDQETGEVFHSYTMITTNCDSHPVMSLMHKYDPKFAPDKQDKRSVVSVEREDWDQWLNGSHEQAKALIQPPKIDVLAHGPADPARSTTLPLF